MIRIVYGLDGLSSSGSVEGSGNRRICIVAKYTPGGAWGRVLCSQEMGEVSRKKVICWETGTLEDVKSKGGMCVYACREPDVIPLGPMVNSCVCTNMNTLEDMIVYYVFFLVIMREDDDAHVFSECVLKLEVIGWSITCYTFSV